MDDQQLNKEKIWNTVLAALKTEVSEGAFNTYLKVTTLWELNQAGERWIGEIGCNSAFIKNTLEQRYWGQIARELERVVEGKCEVVFKIKSRPTLTSTTEGPEAGLPLFEDKRENRYAEVWRKANLKEDFTFESYAVAGSNQMAYAAAQAVTKKPGSAYNPLFIYGGVGVGKTHLMQAIGHEIIKNGEVSVLFCTGEEFTNDLVEAIRLKSTEKVRAKYRKVKLLMIDDVQFIAGKATVQEEFFHTFNSIQREGGQIVMTSDKPPTEISKLEERLKSRFGAGLIVDIGPANFELRTAILLIKAKLRGTDLTMETAQVIAANIEGVRELQGFLVKLETEEKVRGRKMEAEEVRTLLELPQTGNGKTRIITPTEVTNTVGAFYGVGVQQLKGERRLKTIVWPRQVLMFLLRNDLRLPLEEVGRLVGGRDHSTVLHAEGRVKSELIDNHRFQAELAELRRKIFAAGG
jgi:chromosomal replication initiator protein